MSPADFWYVLIKSSFFQNMESKIITSIEHSKNQDQNRLKSKWFARLISFWKYYLGMFICMPNFKSFLSANQKYFSFQITISS